MLSPRHCKPKCSRLSGVPGQNKPDISVPISLSAPVALHRLLVSRRSPRRRQSRPRPRRTQTLPSSKRRAAKPRSAPSTRHARPSGSGSAKSAPRDTSTAGTNAKGAQEAPEAANANGEERRSGRCPGPGPGRRGDEPITTTATSGTTATDPQDHATTTAILSYDRTMIAKMCTGPSGESAAAAPKGERQIGMAVERTETMSGATSAIGRESRRSGASATVDRVLGRLVETKNNMQEPGRARRGWARTQPGGRSPVGRRLSLRSGDFSALVAVCIHLTPQPVSSLFTIVRESHQVRRWSVSLSFASEASTIRTQERSAPPRETRSKQKHVSARHAVSGPTRRFDPLPTTRRRRRPRPAPLVRDGLLRAVLPPATRTAAASAAATDLGRAARNR